jgi:hypothetical protein
MTTDRQDKRRITEKDGVEVEQLTALVEAAAHLPLGAARQGMYGELSIVFGRPLLKIPGSTIVYTVDET